MTEFYLPIIMMSIIISVMLFTFLCSLSVRKAKSSTVPVQAPKIKYKTTQTPVTIKETHTRIEDLIQPAIVDPETFLTNKMKYYSDETVNELR